MSLADCLLMAQSGHLDCVGECPLSGVKRTPKFKSVTSAFDPKRTLRAITEATSLEAASSEK
jgi:hypothetical protein